MRSARSPSRRRSTPWTGSVPKAFRPANWPPSQMARSQWGNAHVDERRRHVASWLAGRRSQSPRVSRFGESPNLGLGALKSNVISALAFDDLGRLWAGNFRDGIDVIAPDGLSDGRRVTHLESEAVREINALVWDGKSRRMLAATAQGLIRFDGSFGSALSKADGLLSNSVLGVAVIQGGTATAWRSPRAAASASATRSGFVA